MIFSHNRTLARRLRAKTAVSKEFCRATFSGSGKKHNKSAFELSRTNFFSCRKVLAIHMQWWAVGLAILFSTNTRAIANTIEPAPIVLKKLVLEAYTHFRGLALETTSNVKSAAACLTASVSWVRPFHHFDKHLSTGTGTLTFFNVTGRADLQVRCAD